jgi:uncharacterized RDD family membrane protein YckC
MAEQLGPLEYAAPTQTPPPPAYVYFHTDDYAPFWRRFITLIVDGAVVALLCFLATLPLSFTHAEGLPPWMALLWLAIIWSYLALLKRTSFRTLGYRLMGLQIVGYTGKPPTIFQMTIRPAITFFFTPLFDDLSWIPSDRCRQALRDKFACTYVIRKGASPAGTGRLVYTRHFFIGRQMLFREIARSDGPT